MEMNVSVFVNNSHTILSDAIFSSHKSQNIFLCIIVMKLKIHKLYLNDIVLLLYSLGSFFERLSSRPKNLISWRTKNLGDFARCPPLLKLIFPKWLTLDTSTIRTCPARPSSKRLCSVCLSFVLLCSTPSYRCST